MPTTGAWSANKLTKMPPMKLPSRQANAAAAFSSTMKRHASFDSPAEIPLPSPSPNSAGILSASINQYPFPDVTGAKAPPTATSPPSDSASSGTSSGPSSLFDGSPRSDFSSPPSSNEKSSPPDSLAQPVLLHPRPYSVPEDLSPGSPHKRERPPLPHRSSTIKALPSQPQSRPTMGSGYPDRTSTASLPLPSHIPFSALPRRREPEENAIISRMTNATALPLSSLQKRGSAPARSRQGASSGTRKHHNSATSSSKPPSPPSTSAGLGRSASLHTSSPSMDSSTNPTFHLSSLYQHAEYPAPDPPQILDANDRPIGPVTPLSSHSKPSSPPTDDGAASDSESSTISNSSSVTSTNSAPYVPFLSQLPAPNGTYIEVETFPHEYILHVRLPGFQRDGITLATKRRRILHVVADSWADTTLTLASNPTLSKPHSSPRTTPGGTGLGGRTLSSGANASSSTLSDNRENQRQSGGHFERRIAFGYDADLVQVRAEFDGEMLRVYIPRKTANQGWGVTG